MKEDREIEKFTFHSDKESVEKIYNWIKNGRGINVWQSQELRIDPPIHFTPGDVERLNTGLTVDVMSKIIAHIPSEECGERISLFYSKEHSIPTEKNERKKFIENAKKNNWTLNKICGSYCYAEEWIEFLEHKEKENEKKYLD